MRFITVASLLALVPWSALVAAQSLPLFEPPPLVRFTGAFQPLGEQEYSGLPTLTVSIKKIKWTFRIAKVEKLTGRTATGLGLLQSLFPPQVRFVGPDALLGPLQDAEIAGQPLTIEGRLYVRDRILFVIAVKEGKEEEKQLQPEGFL